MSQRVEMASNIQPKKIGLNVRRDGPQPSSFVRSFSPITTKTFLHPIARFTAHLIIKFPPIECLLSNLGANCLLPLQKENSSVRNFLLAVVCKRPVSPQSGHQP